MKIFIENSMGKYVVSRLIEYDVPYYVDYTSYKTGYNIFGTAMNTIYPPKQETKRCYSTRYKAGIALSSQFLKEVDAIDWAKKVPDSTLILNVKLHSL